jgi:hypothetical protein
MATSDTTLCTTYYTNLRSDDNARKTKIQERKKKNVSVYFMIPIVIHSHVFQMLIVDS